MPPPLISSTPAGVVRVALYSHDTVGLGHLRRNLAIAAALVRADPRVEALLLSGSPHARVFGLPPRTDVISLPAVRKTAQGAYAPRSLGADLARVLRLRSAALAAALTAFDPDVVIVDKVPGGVGGELVDALERLRGRTRVVLGLRDVLDDPTVTASEWLAQDAFGIIERYFHAVWIYGDPGVYDLTADCPLPPAVRSRTTFTGYLGRGFPSPVRALPQIVCTVGGGEDGGRLVRAFAEARLPADRRGVLITGPDLPSGEREAVRRLAARRSDLDVVDVADDCGALLASAEAVIAMGGYNTIVEILSTSTPALIVPRTAPRREQLLRAERLAARGLVDLLSPERLRPAALSSWLRTRGPHRVHRRGVDLAGLDRLPALVSRLPTPSVPEVADVAV